MRHGWLTTLRRDGSPRTSRVWFVECENVTWIATSASAWKVRDIRRDPRTTFAIEGVDGASGYDAFTESPASHPDVLARFRQDYDGWDAADPADYGPRVLLRLRPRVG